MMAVWVDSLGPLWPASLFAMATTSRPARREDQQVDRDLLDRCKRGDPRAMQELYQRHADAVYRRLTHLVGPVPEREDLLQEVFLALFSRISAFRGEASLTTYLHRIAANKAYDHLRRKIRRTTTTVLQSDLDDVAAPSRSPEGEAQRSADVARFWRNLDRIKPKKRIALVLRVVEGHSLQEIADQVEASVPTVAQRIRHARMELAELVRRGRDKEDSP